MKILVIKSSANGAQSASNRLIDAALKSLPATAEVIVIDLHANPPAYWTGPGTQEPQNQRHLEQLFAADRIIIGAPMYNFGVPAVLKSWMDWVAVAGKSFAYTSEGPKGLLGGRKAIVVATRGGVYGDASPMEHQASHLSGFLGFLGIDSRLWIAEGLAMGQADQVMEKAISTWVSDLGAWWLN